MAVFQDDSMPVRSCIPSPCLLQKQSSNHLKKRAFPFNKIYNKYSPVTSNINLNSVKKLVGEHKTTFSMQSSHVLLIHTWCMQFCLMADTYRCRTKILSIIKGITLVLLSCKGLSSNWLQVKVTQLYWIRNIVISSYQTYLFQLMPVSRMTLNQFAVSYLTTALFRSTLWINQRRIFLYLYTLIPSHISTQYCH